MSWFTAHPFPQRQAVAFSALVTMASGPLHAQVAPATPPADEQDLPITVRAEEIGGRPDREINLDRNVEITRGQTKLVADTACYRLVEDEVTASGHVQMWRFGDRYQGDSLQLNMATGRGWVLNPQYQLQLNNAQGAADRIDFLGNDQALVVDGTYSTCQGTDPDWYLKSSTLRLDTGRDVGNAGKTVIYFKGMPILATPAMSFSLSGARRSGWLPPSLDFGSKGKSEIMVPYYFNIAPNRDLTVFPRMMFDRGLQLGATARYIGETKRGGAYGGETHVEVLPSDRITKTDRWLVNSFHNQTLAPGWTAGWNLHGASDDEYPSDFSRTVSTSAERQLVRELYTGYVTPFWSLTARAQNFQVLQEPAAATNPALTIPRPYDRLPQINFHTGRYDVKGFDWAIDAEATRFSHPTFDSGNRLVTVSQVSYPWVRPGYYVTPKLMLHATKYDMDSNARSLTGKTSLSRTLPIFSVDSGMVFERDASLFGKAVTQTLEPRLFYVRTPYRDQDEFPLFDSGEAGFSYAQLFSENRFVGNDRVSDANQVTAALVSRYIEPDGAERLRMAIGQRFYIEEPRVGRSPTGQGKSDLLLAASGRIIDHWNFDSSVQYDATSSGIFAQSHGVRYTPGPMKVLNAEYRYVRDSFRNADLSAQWPLSKRWYGVGRVSYSLRDHKVLESLVGLEYKADCWVFRMGGQRFVTAARTTSSHMFFQLELNGLSRLGFGNPLDAFYKSIPGYTRLNSNVGRP